MTSSLDDFASFVRENLFLAIVTAVFLGAMVYFISSMSPSKEALPDLPTPPEPGITSAYQESHPDNIKQEVPKQEPPTVIVPVRPAQIGVPDLDVAKDAAFEIANSIPELENIPKTIKAGVSFYVINPDGSRTDLPESNLSFTLGGGGTLRTGIASGINVRIRIPAARLEELRQDLCQGIKDMMANNEVEIDPSVLSAYDKITLVAEAIPIANRCKIDY